jgi:hypothetical protein
MKNKRNTGNMKKRRRKKTSDTNKQTKKLPSIMIFEMPEMANYSSGRRGRDRTVVVFTTTNAISGYHH